MTTEQLSITFKPPRKQGRLENDPEAMKVLEFIQTNGGIDRVQATDILGPYRSVRDTMAKIRDNGFPTLKAVHGGVTKNDRRIPVWKLL